MSNEKILITESTKKVLEDELGEDLEELTEEEIVTKANKTKKVVAKFVECGKVEIKQSLNG